MVQMYTNQEDGGGGERREARGERAEEIRNA